MESYENKFYKVELYINKYQDGKIHERDYRKKERYIDNPKQVYIFSYGYNVDFINVVEETVLRNINNEGDNTTKYSRNTISRIIIGKFIPYEKAKFRFEQAYNIENKPKTTFEKACIQMLSNNSAGVIQTNGKNYIDVDGFDLIAKLDSDGKLCDVKRVKDVMLQTKEKPCLL